VEQQSVAENLKRLVKGEEAKVGSERREEKPTKKDVPLTKNGSDYGLLSGSF